MVVSVHSHHAGRIYAGVKRFEFRRVGAGFAPGDLVFIYETAPVGSVTGTAWVEHVLRAEAINTGGATGTGHVPVVGAMAALESDLSERAYVERYLNGASSPVALRLADASRFTEPWPLSRLGLGRPPQSYQFLGA